MQIHGEERTHFLEHRHETRSRGDGSTYSHHYTVPHNGHNIFFEINVEVYSFNGFVQPGQFAFPFAFIVSTKLLSLSFSLFFVFFKSTVTRSGTIN